jgi:cysteine sulfinate desulfinase/cysteine desulfurase-like protein
MSQRIYLDFNATTPLSKLVKAELLRLLELDLGNPSSRHWAGAPAAEIVELSRIRVASLIGCDPTEIIFTSGGTEANNHAIKGVFFANHQRFKQPHFITNLIEHPAVTEPLRFLETLGARVTRVPVDGYGLVNPDDVRRSIEPETVLISVMLGNNEVGTIQPNEVIAAIAREHEILFHTDAAQAVGKFPVDVESMGVDLLSIAGHKLYAPQGIGALYVREGIELTPFMHGAGHEGGRHAGTENIFEIAALTAIPIGPRNRPEFSKKRWAVSSNPSASSSLSSQISPLYPRAYSFPSSRYRRLLTFFSSIGNSWAVKPGTSICTSGGSSATIRDGIQETHESMVSQVIAVDRFMECPNTRPIKQSS